MATLHNIGSKIKALSAAHSERLYFALIILLVGILAFALGRLSVIYGDQAGAQSDFKIICPTEGCVTIGE